MGNVFIAAACVAYYGAFTSSYREKVLRTNDMLYSYVKQFSVTFYIEQWYNVILLYTDW